MRRRPVKSAVKSQGSTLELPLILAGLSPVEAGGQLAGPVTDAEARKCGDQTGLDTLVVHTVNDDNSLLASNVSGLGKPLSYPPGEYAGNGETQRN